MTKVSNLERRQCNNFGTQSQALIAETILALLGRIIICCIKHTEIIQFKQIQKQILGSN